jgi:hypothetical protein
MEWTRELDVTEARLDAAAPGADLSDIVASLHAQVAEAIQAVQDSAPLSPLAARADENLELARIAGDHGQDGVPGTRFLLRRVIQRLRALEAELLAGTREADRQKNRRDFVNG